MVWKKIGKVGVDSGQLLVCDPSYIGSQWEDEEFESPDEYVVFPDGKKEKIIRCSKRWFELIDDINLGKLKLIESKKTKKAKHNFSYNACAKNTLEKSYGQLNFKLGHPGVGVVFSSGLGDGSYEVWADFVEYKDWGVRIREVKIILIEDEKRKKIMKGRISKSDIKLK